MFKVIATVVMLVAGQPSGDPHVLTSTTGFPTMEACEAARTSADTNGPSEAGLKQYLENQGMEATVTTECKKVDDSE